MKMFPKMQDHTIDRLLRAQSGGSGKELPLCREFDADLANAYVERSLTRGETASFEQHLAACSPCRKAIVALKRMAEADAAAAPVGQARGESRATRWLGMLTPPQWAMATAAAVVLALTLPLVLSRINSQKSSPPALDGSSLSRPADNSPANAAQAASDAPATAAYSTADAAREPGASGRATASVNDNAVADAREKKEASAEPSAPSRDEAAAGATAAAQPAEPKPAEPAVAKNDSASPAGAAPPVTQPVTAEAQPLAKIDPEKAKQLPDDKDAAPAKTIKPGQSDGEERKAADVAVRADDGIAPPPPPPSRAEAERSRHREGVRASGPSAFVPPGSEAASAPRGASRKVGNHIFWLRGETWTDKDYAPNKDMPFVIVIRGSDVYNDLLAKEKKMKPFLTDFPLDQRVIFVFKGKVYNLIPQPGNR